jgi:hypothetical protein
VLGKLRAHGGGLTDEQDANAELACSQHTAFDLRAGRIVTAHGVNSDGDHG